MAQPTKAPSARATQSAPARATQAPDSPTSTAKSLWKRFLKRTTDAAEGAVAKVAAAPQPQPPPQSSTVPSVPVPTIAAVVEPAPSIGDEPAASAAASTVGDASAPLAKPTGSSRRQHRDVVPGLPRAQTFARQQSELRENLMPVMPSPAERRATSMDRRMMQSASFASVSQTLSNPRASAPDFSHGPRISIPDIVTPDDDGPGPRTIPFAPSVPSLRSTASTDDMSVNDAGFRSTTSVSRHVQAYDDAGAMDSKYTGSSEKHPHGDGMLSVHDDACLPDVASMTSSQYDARIRYELEHSWILNLSMHFRDKSRREKFFVTYRQHPDLWRRVTISLDYRNAPEGSLEMDLLQTKYQRDKNEKIYEAIRESLVDIQFYNTVTNLKLQTVDGRLHVHVVEDVTEIIDYPTARMVQHLRCRMIRERDIDFDSHMSGFVYKVHVDGRLLIKKEIPGPDSVDEFLYEVNALNFLSHSQNVIEFYGVIVDDDDRVRGLLISYAEQGALIDIIYDCNHTIPWATRARWARQIVQGLSEIHEAGFVQGDFTLSNIVIDNDGKAKIIDINRRGCPVGWEPPEATSLIESGQRISMYIGVKSDLYQLGMVLWALATQDDEPEGHPRPLHLSTDVDVPPWYRTIVETCLDEDPRARAQARQLVGLFPRLEGDSVNSDSDYDDDEWASGSHPVIYTTGAHSASDEEGDTIHVTTEAAVESGPGALNEYDEKNQLSDGGIAPHIKTVEPSSDWSYVNFGHTYVDPVTGFSNEPYYYPMRGRSPPSPMPSNYGCGPSYPALKRRTSSGSASLQSQDSPRGRQGQRSSSSGSDDAIGDGEDKDDVTTAPDSAVEVPGVAIQRSATNSTTPPMDEGNEVTERNDGDLARPTTARSAANHGCQDNPNVEEMKARGAGSFDAFRDAKTSNNEGKMSSHFVSHEVLAEPEMAA